MIAKLRETLKELDKCYGVIFMRQATLAQEITDMEEEFELAIARGDVDGLDPSFTKSIDDKMALNDVYEDYLDDCEELSEEIKESINLIKPTDDLINQGTKMELRFHRIITNRI